jgi:hypothetical protein
MVALPVATADAALENPLGLLWIHCFIHPGLSVESNNLSGPGIGLSTVSNQKKWYIGNIQSIFPRSKTEGVILCSPIK